MKKDMKQVLSLLYQKQSTVRSAALILMAMVFASRILGLLRDRMLAARFGPDELGVYFAAFRLPNLLFEILVMGALTSAFIPVFTKYLTQENEKAAWKLSAVVMNICSVVLVIISIPMIIWAHEFSRLIAPGFTGPEIDRMAQFTQFMILFQVFPLLIGNFLTGILQSYNMFLAPAIAPVIYNVGIIAGILFLTPSMGVWAPVVGVGIGAVLFMAIQVPPLLKLGYRHSADFDIHHKGVREVGKLMLPRALGLGVAQIDTTVDLVLSTLLGARMVTVFYFAQHLQQLPIGLFGATIAQAAFPLLSIASAKNDHEHFRKTLISAVNQVTFFVMPISALFIVLRIPIVRLVFGASKFDWEATVLTGMTLSMFSLSLSAQAASQILTRGFYALYDSMAPVVIGIGTILLNTVLSIAFISYFHLPVWSLGLSTTISSILNAMALLVLLKRKLNLSIGEFFVAPSKMLLASVVMGIALFIPLKLFDQLIFDTTRTFGLLLLTGISGTVGLLWYVFLVWVFGVGEAKSFMEMLLKVRKPKNMMLNSASEVVNNGASEAPIT